MDRVADRLHREVVKFQEWAGAKGFSEATGGEWEVEYAGWTSLYRAVTDLIETPVAGWWREEVRRDLLYALARDNEAELIAEELRDMLAPETIVDLARAAVDEGSRDARWQLAVLLVGVPPALRDEAESVLLVYRRDPHEYVRRRALQSLARLGSVHAEREAVAAMNDERPYAQMMGLYALAKVRSLRLAHYLDLVEGDPDESLSAYARRIRAGDFD